jgi:hypothetical protein
MKSQKVLIALTLSTLFISAFIFLARAQTPGTAPRYEVAMVKWDGPDKIQLITPQKSEYLRVFKAGVQLPADIHDEEFCLTWAANKIAQEGWDPVNLNATRILLRRAINR